MATLVLGAVGTAVGGSFGGAILGLSGAAIGGMIGSTVGSIVDSALMNMLAPTQRMEGPRLDALRVVSSTEGVVIPRVFGRMRIGGNIVWATDFREEVTTTSQGGGKSGPRVRTTEFAYYASFAVAVAEGPISGIGRIWADGKPLDTSAITLRVYPGDEAQEPDPLIASVMGEAPAYRGVAYVVFEELPLEQFGNRLPQLSFEVFRPLVEDDTVEGSLRAVAVIPGAGEFSLATTAVRRDLGDGESAPENVHAEAAVGDFAVSLDRLLAAAPLLESVTLVVAWFGTDLRAGACEIRPKVENADKVTDPLVWRVNGLTRGAAQVVSQIEGRPAYGGTPSDAAVIEAIAACKARALRVTLLPFVLMDVPPGNSLPDPYSDNAAGTGQPAFPWRGRITVSPAAGFAGTVDKTAAAATQIAALFGSAAAGDFAVSGATVDWTGGADWGLRRQVLHYAHLAVAAGGVDAILIGSEMRGVTQARSGASAYPAVQALRDLAAAVRGVVGAGCEISYAADWSEYFGHQPADGTGDVFFHLDPLWADAEIDFVGIDNYLPLSDWRDGTGHADAAAGWRGPADRAYLRAGIAGGEGFDWFYASDADRQDQTRSDIADGSAGKPWVFRPKDLLSWWSEQHFDRPGGVEGGTPTAWVPESKPIVFTEFGCPAVDRGANQPNVFFDPKSSESLLPHFSRGWRDDAVQRSYLDAHAAHWADAAHNPVSTVYGQPMVRWADCAAWAWDARPYPWFPALEEVWSDGPNWRLGHWLTGRLGSAALPALVRALCLRAGLPADRIDVSGLWGAVEGYTIAALESPRASISMLARHFGFGAVETGGVIRFAMRPLLPVAELALDDLAVTGQGEPFEMTRGQETELPAALKWQVVRADEEYDPAPVEARRATARGSVVTLESFPVAVPPEEADRRCRRALHEAWAARETLGTALPPSRLAVDPDDVIRLQHDGRAVDYRVVTTADAEARRLEAVRWDAEALDLAPGVARDTRLAGPLLFGPPLAEAMDLPQLRENEPETGLAWVVHAQPWPGPVAVWRAPPGSEDWAVQDVFRARPVVGKLAEPLPAPACFWRTDRAGTTEVTLLSGTLASVTDAQFLRGGNTFAVEVSGGWEVFQARDVDLIAPGRYRLSHMLRGQRGTEHLAVSPSGPDTAPAGARFVVLDGRIGRLPARLGERGNAFRYRLGPAWLDVESPALTEVQAVWTGVSTRSFAPRFRGNPARRGWQGGDLLIRWHRRSRAPAADSWDLGEVPLPEDGVSAGTPGTTSVVVDGQTYQLPSTSQGGAEEYFVFVVSGSTVVGGDVVTEPEWLFTEAAQAAAFGDPLAPGDTLTVLVQQASLSFGPGQLASVQWQL